MWLAYTHYYTHATGIIEEWESLGAFRRIKRALANGYRNHRFGMSERPASQLGVPAAMLLARQRAIIEAEGRSLPKVWPGASVLDVGCGNGTFLDFARRAGWKAVGVDLDPNAVAVTQARGIEVHLGSANVLEPRTERFDVITLSHVIEHVHDPLELLETCRRLLKPGGWIWLQTPNLDSQGHWRYGHTWRGLEPPRHLVLFTPASLRKLLIAAGFQSVRDMPYTPLCRQIFSASEAIAAGRDPNDLEPTLILFKVVALRAEGMAKRHSSVREFITVRAQPAAGA